MRYRQPICADRSDRHTVPVEFGYDRPRKPPQRSVFEGVKELIVQGYLEELGGKRKADTSELHIRGGEFVPPPEKLMDDESLVQSACQRSSNRRRIAAAFSFAAGIRAKHVRRCLAERKARKWSGHGRYTGWRTCALLARFKRGP